MPSYYSNSSGNINFRLRYDTNWAQKSPSANGEFKYGLCQCCCGPAGTQFESCCYIFSYIFCPLTLGVVNCMLNGEIASIVGTIFS